MIVRLSIDDIPVITNTILVNFCGFTKDQAKRKIAYSEKVGQIIKVKRGVYINPLKEVKKEELSNTIFQGSYISLESILFEAGMIKQFAYSVKSVSCIYKSEDFLFGGILFSNYNIKIDSNLGIVIENNIRKATKERALLDVIYLKIFSKNYGIDSEVYIPDDLDRKLIFELLDLYGSRVKNYYLKNIAGAQKIF